MARGIYVVLLIALCLFQSSRGYPTSTEPSNFCVNEDGHHYGIGEHYSPHPCTFCYCEGPGEQCSMAGCLVPSCPNPTFTESNQCCPICPNGPACLGFHNEEVPLGRTVTYPDGRKCMCTLPYNDDFDIYMYFGPGLNCAMQPPSNSYP